MPSTVIIDTDPGVDDAFAILYALASPELRVCAFTLVHGNSPLQCSTRNLATLLDALHRQHQSEGFDSTNWERPVVAIGANEPLNVVREGAEFFHGPDGFGGVHASHAAWTRDITRPAGHPLYTVSARDGADEILHQLRKEPANTVTILAIGPVTNLALAIERDARTFARARRVISMGGAVRIPGNVTPTSEFNFWGDPLAAQLVLERTLAKDPEERVEVVLVPLDPLETLRFPRKMIDFGASESSIPIAQFFSVIARHTFDLVHRFTGSAFMPLIDVAVTQMAIDLVRANDKLENCKELGWEIVAEDIRVESQGSWTRGMTIVDRRAELKGAAKATAEHIKVEKYPDPQWTEKTGATHVHVCYKMDGDRCVRESIERVYKVSVDGL
ncbi:Inosine/uridine-preferring nucleoside hydrolase domain-containing protein [Thamnocephalis sphaerospora]|uniref:Inosine/uridine-preferring nucleoside hydrolase domain-containing protein n=1 Tax=Thamnocephalis sphaerospora TaxID=78915 RepID=A0A4P9XTA0_9FUNG|nr:Inosine/uridine-preferring nucleoside hydrolase domain-containing protein [Thamnocephalis sphaerospora]|eukprot:RKP09394.1 Inosine/uridine-preferring nucleoside hydrolase domain-containing protein [Thamnocephalis sphaerospora]